MLMGEKRKSHFWSAFWGVFIGLTVFMLIVEILYSFIERQKVRSVVNRLVPKLEETLPQVLREASPEVKQLIASKREELYHELENQLGIFIKTHSNVEGYLDWLYGSFTDYKVAWRKLLDLVSRGKSHTQAYFQEQFDTYLIPKEEFNTFVETQVKPIIKQKTTEFYDELSLLLKGKLKEKLLGEIGGELGDVSDQIIDQALNQMVEMTVKELTVKMYPQFRIVGTGVGGIIGAIFAKKILAKLTTKIAVKLESKIAAKLLAKGALKLGAKAGGAAAGAAEGAILCSIFGPLGSITCGAIGGLISWILSDVVVAKIDEFLNRDETRGEVYAMLDEFKESFAKEVSDEFAKNLETAVMPLFEGANLGRTPRDVVGNSYGSR